MTNRHQPPCCTTAISASHRLPRLTSSASPHIGEDSTPEMCLSAQIAWASTTEEALDALSKMSTFVAQQSVVVPPAQIGRMRACLQADDQIWTTEVDRAVSNLESHCRSVVGMLSQVLPSSLLILSLLILSAHLLSAPHPSLLTLFAHPLSSSFLPSHLPVCSG